MSDYVHLSGSEDVRRAGNAISEAADQIRHASNQMQESTERLIRALEEHASRIEAAARGDV